MKNIILFMLSAILILSVAACSDNSEVERLQNELSELRSELALAPNKSDIDKLQGELNELREELAPLLMQLAMVDTEEWFSETQEEERTVRGTRDNPFHFSEDIEFSLIVTDHLFNETTTYNYSINFSELSFKEINLWGNIRNILTLDSSFIVTSDNNDTSADVNLWFSLISDNRDEFNSLSIDSLEIDLQVFSGREKIDLGIVHNQLILFIGQRFDDEIDPDTNFEYLIIRPNGEFEIDGYRTWGEIWVAIP